MSEVELKDQKEPDDNVVDTEIDFEFVLKYIGSFGRYQIALVLLAYWVCIPVGMAQVGSVFLAAIPDHRCRVPPLEGMLEEEAIRNLTIPYDEATKSYESCERYAYNYSTCVNGSLACVQTIGEVTTETCVDGYVYDDSVYTSTVTTEWDLVCDRLIIGTSVTSFYYLGVLFSALIGGNVADLMGRLPTMLVSQLGMAAVGVACAFSPTLVAFAILRFGVAFFLMAGYVACFVYVMEITGEKWRTFVGINVQAAFAVGYMVLSGLAYQWRNWRQLQFVISLFPLPFIICYLLMPESPRWLFTKLRTNKAKQICETMAKRNGNPLPSDIWRKAARKIDTTETEKSKVSPIELFKRPRMRLVTINVMFNWFVISLVYYGLSLNVGSLAGDDFVNNTLSGLVELISFPIVILTIDRFGRRIILFLSLLIGGVACLSSTVANWYAGDNEALLTLGTVLALLGKMSVSGSFAIIYNYTAELYPTNIRSTAVGLGSMSARLGSVLTPFTIQLQYLIPWLTGTVFGVMSLCACITSLMFPETMGSQLLTTLDEAEEFYKIKRKSSSKQQKPHEDVAGERGQVNGSYL